MIIEFEFNNSKYEVRLEDISPNGIYQLIDKSYVLIETPSVELQQEADKNKNDFLSREQLEKRKKEIYQELETIDKKSIRAIRESNQDLINQYENEAELLRTELQGLL